MKTKKKIKINSRTVSKYVFLLPGFCMFCFAIAIPFLSGINIAFTDWNGITKDYNYVGFDNFVAILHDQRIRRPVLNSLKFALFGVIGSNFLSLGTAMLVNYYKGRFSNVIRTVFFMPVCFSSILTAFLWRFIYKEVLSQIFGISSLLGNPHLVIIAIVVMGIWNTCGINMLIYLSGLKNIPSEVISAAKIDGASAWQTFRYVTIPLLMPSFTVCVTMSMTSWLKEFATTLSATRGGPSGASQTALIYIFENLFTYNKAGYGQAAAFAYALILILLGNIVSSFFRRREVEM